MFSFRKHTSEEKVGARAWSKSGRDPSSHTRTHCLFCAEGWRRGGHSRGGDRAVYATGCFAAPEGGMVASENVWPCGNVNLLGMSNCAL